MNNEIKNKLLLLQEEVEKQLQKFNDTDSLDELYRQVLGKKGKLTLILKEIPKLPQNERTEAGRLVNEVKTKIEAEIKKKINQQSAIPAKGRSASGGSNLQSAQVDITVPGIKPAIGYLHPVTQAIFEIEDIFGRLGFVRRRYPEVELDYYAFEALNMPEEHPARDDFETFYITDKIILTPHTSSGQVREIEKGGLPIRMLNIAKCYRPQIDASHTPMFFQFEGLLLDKDVSIAELKGTLDFFAENYFGKGSKMRLRPYDFRFTEPSFEVDVTCTNCNGVGCRFCKEGWLELGGAGMVHPKVIENGGLDPKKVNGFAFGWGVERVAAIKHKIPDIRMLYQNDLRFLEQF